MYYFLFLNILFSRVLIGRSSLPFYYYPGFYFISLKHETIPLVSFSTNSSGSFLGLTFWLQLFLASSLGVLLSLDVLCPLFFFSQKSFFVIPRGLAHISFGSLVAMLDRKCVAPLYYTGVSH